MSNPTAAIDRMLSERLQNTRRRISSGLAPACAVHATGCPPSAVAVLPGGGGKERPVARVSVEADEGLEVLSRCCAAALSGGCHGVAPMGPLPLVPLLPAPRLALAASAGLARSRPPRASAAVRRVDCCSIAPPCCVLLAAVAAPASMCRPPRADSYPTADAGVCGAAGSARGVSQWPRAGLSGSGPRAARWGSAGGSQPLIRSLAVREGAAGRRDGGTRARPKSAATFVRCCFDCRRRPTAACRLPVLLPSRQPCCATHNNPGARRDHPQLPSCPEPPQTSGSDPHN